MDRDPTQLALPPSTGSCCVAMAAQAWHTDSREPKAIELFAKQPWAPEGKIRME